MTELKWWQKAVFYQIYPRSFADANGDGIGDLEGMISRLDYMQNLGIDAVWLSPHYPSPLLDCGYDIADYTGVAPEYGNLDDFKRFLEGAHHRGIRLILDLVLNHTSDQHRWFIESRSTRNNPRRDWYIWKDGVNGGPPNNWVSPFGGPAWEYDPAIVQYYYHFFFKEQPDLNWRNPEVKQAMFDAARFWLDMGVDGFRLDAIGTIFEAPSMPDHPVPYTMAQLRKAIDQAKTSRERARLGDYWRQMYQYQFGQPGMHALMQELRTVIDEYEDRMLVAEDDDISYHGSGDNEMHLVFNFPLMRTKKLTPKWIRANQDVRLAALSKISPASWPCNTLGNHDSPRIYNRFGDGKHDQALARISLALMLTLPGTPFLYNGEEIGMTDLMLEDIRQFRDMLGVWGYQAAIDELGLSASEALKHAAELTRDKNRTPMQWDSSPNAGFCPANVEPWLPVHPNFAKGINVASQEDDPGSLLNFYRRMLRLRRQTPALITGDYTPLLPGHADMKCCLAFLRRTRGQTCLVILNFCNRKFTLDLRQAPEMKTFARQPELIYSSCPRQEGQDDLSQLSISPYEIYIAGWVAIH
ncbi:MAG: alpha-glucosidase [Chloroflexota bacterium]|nr:MAG: alpha-glucosidase [Chloroflexota bacterium]